MIKLLVIADDLTGACDTGVQFSRQNFPVLITSNRQIDCYTFSDIEVLVINIESRHLTADKASARVQKLVHSAVKSGIQYFFKKTDSTLRGNVGSELNALMQAAGCERLAFVPAYPQMKRFTRNGYQYIENKLLHETELRLDPLEPVTSSYVPEIIQKQTETAVHLVTRDVYRNKTSVHFKDGITVFDCESNEDLVDIKDTITTNNVFRLFAGPAAFAEKITSLIALNRKSEMPRPTIKLPLLFVNGSMNPKSLRQIQKARHAGIPEIIIPQAYFSGAASEHFPLDLLTKVEKQKSKHDGIIISTNSSESVIDRDHTTSKGDGLFQGVADKMGMLCTKLLDKNWFPGWVIFGGDTISGILAALSVDVLQPMNELMPGLPVLTIPDKRLILMSKAGGFGSEDLILEILDRVRKGL